MVAIAQSTVNVTRSGLEARYGGGSGQVLGLSFQWHDICCASRSGHHQQTLETITSLTGGWESLAVALC